MYNTVKNANTSMVNYAKSKENGIMMEMESLIIILITISNKKYENMLIGNLSEPINK
jgi:hypothetical protein